MENSNALVNKYLTGLKQAFYANNGKETWDPFEEVKHGVDPNTLEQLKSVFPEVPESLIQLLKNIDGTYWREYDDETFALLVLGSDVGNYPYYLLSTQEMIDNQNVAQEYYADFLSGEIAGVQLDDKIFRQADQLKWLHFSDCMNNGGTSQLFIDFNPSSLGTKGQVVRFLHDPDEFKVIADSFDSYLEMLIAKDFHFVDESMME